MSCAIHFDGWLIHREHYRAAHFHLDDFLIDKREDATLLTRAASTMVAHLYPTYTPLRSEPHQGDCLLYLAAAFSTASRT